MAKAEEEYYKMMNDESYLEKLHNLGDICDNCERITGNYIKELKEELKKAHRIASTTLADNLKISAEKDKLEDQDNKKTEAIKMAYGVFVKLLKMNLANQITRVHAKKYITMAMEKLKIFKKD